MIMGPKGGSYPVPPAPGQSGGPMIMGPKGGLHPVAPVAGQSGGPKIMGPKGGLHPVAPVAGQTYTLGGSQMRAAPHSHAGGAARGSQDMGNSHVNPNLAMQSKQKTHDFLLRGFNATERSLFLQVPSLLPDSNFLLVHFQSMTPILAFHILPGVGAAYICNSSDQVKI
jgi:hypothetical protein